MNMVEHVHIEMRRDLATELVEILELEVREADEYHSTEQVMEEAAQTISDAL